MNSPIFNPIWFYFIELCDRFGFTFVIIGCLTFGISLIFMFINLMEGDENPKFLKRLVFIGGAVALIGSFIPSKDTCYKMIVTSYITPSNIEAVKGEATDLIDYIVDKVDELTDNEEKDD